MNPKWSSYTLFTIISSIGVGPSRARVELTYGSARNIRAWSSVRCSSTRMSRQMLRIDSSSERAGRAARAAGRLDYPVASRPKMISCYHLIPYLKSSQPTFEEFRKWNKSGLQIIMLFDPDFEFCQYHLNRIQIRRIRRKIFELDAGFRIKILNILYYQS